MQGLPARSVAILKISPLSSFFKYRLKPGQKKKNKPKNFFSAPSFLAGTRVKCAQRGPGSRVFLTTIAGLIRS